MSIWHERKAAIARRKQALIEKLGGACEECGSVVALTIDHIDGRNYIVSKLSWHCRIKRYETEFHSGVRLRVLCHQCNSTKHPAHCECAACAPSRLQEAPF